MPMSNICSAFYSVQKALSVRLNHLIPLTSQYRRRSRHDLPCFTDEETAALRDLPKPVWPGGGWRWGLCHGLSWPFVLPAQSANDGEASASLERDSGLRAGGERGLSVTVDLAALTSLRFLLNSWIGKQLA